LSSKRFLREVGEEAEFLNEWERAKKVKTGKAKVSVCER